MATYESHHGLGERSKWPGCEERRTLSELVARYDFSGAFCELVPTAPGLHADNQFGHARLAALLAKEKFQEFGDSRLFLQYSSWGAFNGAYKDELLSAMSKGGDFDPERYCIVWPSVDEVRDSIDGYVAGVSIPSAKSLTTTFARNKLRTWSGDSSAFVRARGAAVPHMKTYGRLDSTGTRLAWSVLTSANISQYAWGKFTKGGLKCGTFGTIQ